MKIIIFFFIFIFFIFLSTSFSKSEVLTNEQRGIFQNSSYLDIKIMERNDFVYYYLRDRLFQFQSDDILTLNKIKFTSYLSDITSFTIDLSNKKYVGTKSGLHFDDENGNQTNTIKTFQQDIGMPVYSVECDKKNAIWISTVSGIWEINDNQLTNVFPLENSALKDTVKKIIVDSLNSKWFITLNGVYRYADGNLTQFNSQNSELPDNTINCLKVDKFGNKWFGTKNGLAKYDDTKWTIYKTSNTTLPSDSIGTFAWDSTNTMWICTSKGFGSFDNISKFELEDIYIYPINMYELFIDRFGNYWQAWLFFSSDSYRYYLALALYHKGGIVYSDVEGYDEIKKEFVYPNPVSDFAQIEIGDIVGKTTISAIDLLGSSKVLWTGTLNGDMQTLNLNFSGLSKGFYSLIINSGTKREVRKVIKE